MDNAPNNKIKLLVMLGPTAVGKTALSLKLAQTFAGEIISADSRQVYHGLDIGTAKVTSKEQVLVPHYMIDVVEPDQILTLAEFQAQTYQLIADIHQRGNLPMLVGGTGQWIKAVVEGWGIPKVPPDLELRAELEKQAQTAGYISLHRELASVDPESAQKLDARNVRRVIRALEVYRKTGIPISTHQQKNPPPYQIKQIGLTRPREQLYQRIDDRVDRMIAHGLVGEVQALMAAGYGLQLPAMSGLGYRQIGQYLEQKLSLVEGIALIKKETRRFVRQQYNWFRLNDPQISWFDLSQTGYQPIKTAVQTILNN